ncbi:MAG: hypothetical protein AAGC81_00665 [Pseudomonadota bacterium]
MAIKRDHELHTRRRGRNLGVLLLLVGFVMMLFLVTVIKLGENGVTGNPSAGQGGAWIDGFIKWVRE